MHASTQNSMIKSDIKFAIQDTKSLERIIRGHDTEHRYIESYKYLCFTKNSRLIGLTLKSQTCIQYFSERGIHQKIKIILEIQ